MRSNTDKRNARMAFQSGEYMANRRNAMREDEEKAAKAKRDSLMESAALSYGTGIHNSRVRQQEAQRSLQYADHFATVALTEALSQVAEGALLLDEEAYARYEPDYKEKIRSTIRGFLENADISSENINPALSALYERIVANMPPADLHLTEADEHAIVSDRILSNKNIESKLGAMQGDVSARVARIVENEQAKLGDEGAAVDQNSAAASPDEMAPAPEGMPEGMPEDPNAGAMPDPEMQGAAPAENVGAVPQNLAGPTATVQISPDGTVNVQAPVQQDPAAACPMPEEQPVQEALRFVKTPKKQGIVETLAINEATKMMSSGIEYSSEHAIANAIRYITVLETLDASGIVEIGKDGYDRILAKSGVDMSPKSRIDLPGSDIVDSPVATVEKPAADQGFGCVSKPTELGKLPADSEKDVKVKNDIGGILKSAFPEGYEYVSTDSKVFKPFAEWKKSHPESLGNMADIPDGREVNEDLRGKWTSTQPNLKGKVFTEAALREYFERQGFYDLSEDAFESLWRSWNFKKH